MLPFSRKKMPQDSRVAAIENAWNLPKGILGIISQAQDEQVKPRIDTLLRQLQAPTPSLRAMLSNLGAKPKVSLEELVSVFALEARVAAIEEAEDYDSGYLLTLTQLQPDDLKKTIADTSLLDKTSEERFLKIMKDGTVSLEQLVKFYEGLRAHDKTVQAAANKSAKELAKAINSKKGFASWGATENFPGTTVVGPELVVETQKPQVDPAKRALQKKIIKEIAKQAMLAAKKDFAEGESFKEPSTLSDKPNYMAIYRKVYDAQMQKLIDQREALINQAQQDAEITFTNPKYVAQKPTDVADEKVYTAAFDSHYMKLQRGVVARIKQHISDVALADTSPLSVAQQQAVIKAVDSLPANADDERIKVFLKQVIEIDKRLVSAYYSLEEGKGTEAAAEAAMDNYKQNYLAFDFEDKSSEVSMDATVQDRLERIRAINKTELTLGAEETLPQVTLLAYVLNASRGAHGSFDTIFNGVSPAQAHFIYTIPADELLQSHPLLMQDFQQFEMPEELLGGLSHAALSTSPQKVMDYYSACYTWVADNLAKVLDSVITKDFCESLRQQGMEMNDGVRLELATRYLEGALSYAAPRANIKATSDVLQEARAIFAGTQFVEQARVELNWLSQRYPNVAGNWFDVSETKDLNTVAQFREFVTELALRIPEQVTQAEMLAMSGDIAKVESVLKTLDDAVSDTPDLNKVGDALQASAVRAAELHKVRASYVLYTQALSTCREDIAQDTALSANTQLNAADDYELGWKLALHTSLHSRIEAQVQNRKSCTAAFNSEMTDALSSISQEYTQDKQTRSFAEPAKISTFGSLLGRLKALLYSLIPNRTGLFACGNAAQRGLDHTLSKMSEATGLVFSKG